jgi:hypothetical protein
MAGVPRLTSRALDLTNARYDVGAPWSSMTESLGEGCYRNLASVAIMGDAGMHHGRIGTVRFWRERLCRAMRFCVPGFGSAYCSGELPTVPCGFFLPSSV